VTRALLENHGGIAVTVASAPEALRALTEARFDALVADIGMPGQDGYSLIRELRRQTGAGRTIPAIAVTAYASPRERDEALRAGFTAHLGKPLEPMRLIETIASIAALQ
jgi:CheY-like chemotaxis protein